jgi:hypothetical protein
MNTNTLYKMMNYKLPGLLILIFTLKALSINAQVQKADSTKTIGIRCGSRFTAGDQPLMLINGINIKDIRGLSDITPDEVIDVKVVKGQEAIDAYGEQGKNGALLYRIKMNLISSEEILQDEFKKGSCKTQKLIFKPTQGNDQEFNQRHIVYFEKSRVTIRYTGTRDDCIVIVEQR